MIPLRKRLGQHHLVDPATCRPLVEFLEAEGGPVVEIGPGGGVLTGELLAGGCRVLACELDLTWAVELRRRLARPELSIAALDALDIDWRLLPAGTLVTGNLPFNVATPIVERLLLGGQGVPRAGFLVQKEVADRLLAGPGDSDYGALSVLVAARSRARPLGVVPADLFRPPPKVDGAFVGLELVDPPIPFEDLASFLTTVRAAFQLRRKTLRNSLAASWGRSRADAALEALGFEERTRAETLALEDFLRLFQWSSSSE